MILGSGHLLEIDEKISEETAGKVVQRLGRLSRLVTHAGLPQTGDFHGGQFSPVLERRRATQHLPPRGIGSLAK
jgi:hypothetical protein